MKITCQSCASKYTIADEKVAGKTVKIKCKKCGATIVVDGNAVGFQAASPDPYAQQPAPPDEGGGGDEGDGQTSVFTGEQPAPGAPGGGDWTVNVADNDQRTMSSAQLAEAFAAGIVNNDTYVWKDGMGDWLPFSEVPELVALTRKPAAAPAPRPAAGFSPPAP
ncbi:MAG: zinc-ribbon domain-containing protein, partial [Polyangiaceae bacterium]|nr:zinc-ribbon domain-containing protein [Polyangiaceae bacterium]